MTWLDVTVKRVREFDAARPRSLQKSVGWSEVGGCRAHLGFRLAGAWATDDTDSWSAQRGTALHEYLQQILGGPGCRIEVGTSYRGIPGHADIVEADSVTDIKTTKLSNSRMWASDHSVLLQKRIQAHGYAAGLVDAGELPAGCTVRLLVVPVDGLFADWWCYEEPFDRSLADQGADRLEAVRAAVEAGESLPKDMPYGWCSQWCEFFSLCRANDDAAEAQAITDPELAATVAAYGEAVATESAARKAKEQLAPQIRGLRGVAGQWRVSTGRPGDPRPALDEDWIRAEYAARGEQVPLTWKPGSSPRLTVTKVKAKAGAA